MLTFLLNDQLVQTDLPGGTLLLDFIRYHRHLTGTKIGCREGDCGACTVLIGELGSAGLQYRSVTSCLMPLAKVQGRHVVTVEGLNLQELNPIQQALVDESASQCGFCTPGFVVSLAGFCLSSQAPGLEQARAALAGNICRCTGYKSIERAAARVSALLQDRRQQDPASYAAEKKILPAYFKDIRQRLADLARAPGGNGHSLAGSQALVAGGTDLYVQRPGELQAGVIGLLPEEPAYQAIRQLGSRCYIGGAVTASAFGESPLIQKHFPDWRRYLRLVSSTPIRNMATLAGNLVNASPIGDFTIIFLALEATLVLSSDSQVREVPLRQFYRGYKQLDKKPQELIREIWFELPARGAGFNFEKVSKRTHLDIASVNSAMSLQVQEDTIQHIGISAGGVGPVPLQLQQTAAFLQGKRPGKALLQQALDLAQEEISPISDARGTAAYKRLLLNQLLKAHFLTLLPAVGRELLLAG